MFFVGFRINVYTNEAMKVVAMLRIDLMNTDIEVYQVELEFWYHS